jgi:hypothetical protein
LTRKYRRKYFKLKKENTQETLTVCIPHQAFLGLGLICNSYGRDEYKILFGKPEGFTGDLGVDGRTILK